MSDPVRLRSSHSFRSFRPTLFVNAALGVFLVLGLLPAARATAIPTTTQLSTGYVSDGGPDGSENALEEVGQSDGSFIGSHSNSVEPSAGLGDIIGQLNGSAVLDASGLHLTNGGRSEVGSAFSKTLLNIESFTTDFTFQLKGAADGFTFVIQNNGPGSLGRAGGGLGYAEIPRSLAIKFDLHDNAGEGPNSTGLYTNGTYPSTPAISLNDTGIDLHSKDTFKAHITYDGVNLTLTLTDKVTLASWSYFWPIDIPDDVVIGSSGYVGFTGASGALTSTQTITAWTYQAGAPAPNYPAGFINPVGLSINGTAQVKNTALQLTDFGSNEAGTVFYTIPQNIQAFTNDFFFLMLDPNADGLTFTIQNNDPNAIGGSGSGLGYFDIPKSVAIKFDIFNNAGEGGDSTGLYLDGARPSVPAIDLSGTGIDPRNSDSIKVHMTYDGANLTMTVTDALLSAKWSHSWPVDIPATVGGNTAWVGFTGATGHGYSKQLILLWTYVPGMP